MTEFVRFDSDVHTEEFRQLDFEYYTWVLTKTKENDPFDSITYNDTTLPPIVDGHLEILTGLNPPEGIFYLLKVDGLFAGMGGLRKLDEKVARVWSMYIRPNFRERGYGRQLLNRLLDDGREFGYSTFQLRPTTFGDAAIHLYRSAGFTEIDDSESKMSPVSTIWKPYWFDMEKRIG